MRFHIRELSSLVSLKSKSLFKTNSFIETHCNSSLQLTAFSCLFRIGIVPFSTNTSSSLFILFTWSSIGSPDAFSNVIASCIVSASFIFNVSGRSKVSRPENKTHAPNIMNGTDSAVYFPCKKEERIVKARVGVFHHIWEFTIRYAVWISSQECSLNNVIKVINVWSFFK